MAKSGRTQEQVNDLVHRRYTIWTVGDGATTEFPIGKTVQRLDDVVVVVAKQVLRPASNGTPFDYNVRGFVPSYPGDRNTVTFTVAPGAGDDIGFIVNAD